MNLTTSKQWKWLMGMNYPPTIKMEPTRLGLAAMVTETDSTGDILYQYERWFDGKRFTEADQFGMVGVSTTNLEDKTLLVTEGVSDFLALKAIKPEWNVWGKTKLNLSKLQAHMIKNTFSRVIVIGDSDETGIKKALRNSQVLNRVGLTSKIYTPIRFKDLTLELYFDREETLERLEQLRTL